MKTRKYLLIALCIISSLPLFAQYPGDVIELAVAPDGGEVKACHSIVLKPGFSFTASQGKSLTLKADLTICSSHVQENISLSSSQNYIITVTPLDETDKVEINNGQMTVARGARTLTTIQYFDGLGRPMQTVQKGITPGKQDLVSIQEYDAFGRESNAWLPAPISSNGAFTNISGVKTAAQVHYADAHPYSKPVYEASPLNRVLAQFGPGGAWHNPGKAVRTNFLTNNTNIDSLNCAYYFVNASGDLQRKGNYDNSQLFVTRVSDEDGNRTYEFKDKLGQVVLTRQMEGDTKHDTYYVYDDFGLKRFVIPPKAADLLTQGDPYSLSDETIKDYVYAYRYDSRRRNVMKRIPGCDSIAMIYDRADRLILSQDGVQRSKNEWTFNKYDAFGRLILSGIYTDAASHETLRNQFRDIVVKETAEVDNYGYTWNTPPVVTPDKVLLVNYYDDYEHLLNQSPFFRENLNYQYKEGYGEKYVNATCGVCSAKGLLVGTRVKMLDGSGEIVTTMYYYDDKGRIIQQKSTNHLGGFEKEYYAYTFTGQPIRQLKEHSIYSGDVVSELYTFEYDHAGRQTHIKHQLNGQESVLLSKNEYDDLGRLKTKHLNKEKEPVSYHYNVRGWVEQINSPTFNETLYYNEPLPGGTACYNGNISGLASQIVSQRKNIYQYSYDGLSRLLESRHTEETASSGKKDFTELFRYDKQGNIENLKRYGLSSVSMMVLTPPGGIRLINHYDLVEDLDYAYQGNQLKSVQNRIEPVSLPMGSIFEKRQELHFKDLSSVEEEYLYDANGNVTADLNKEIVTVRYNLLNLPQVLQARSGNTTEYLYSSSGEKLRTVHKTSRTDLMVPVGMLKPVDTDFSNLLTTDYVGNKIYENGSLKRILTESGYIQNGMYYTYLKDHLGNNHVVLDESQNVIQRTWYYASGTSDSDDSSFQPYLYSGKELDRMHGLDWYDFHARMHDPLLSRFMSIDPLAEKYYSISPYVYCSNNPVNATDPTGMWVQYKDSTGNYRYDNGQWYKYQTSGEKTGEYTPHTPDSGSFLEGVLTGLNQLNNNVTGNKLLSFFANDDNNAFIVPGTENTADISDSALGTITLTSDFQGSQIPTENGIQKSPFWLDIGHELAHRQDVLKNGAAQAGDTWLTQPDGKEIKQSEKYATHMENLMRADAGLPLRTHYASRGTGGWRPSRVVNARTRVSIYYGTRYSSMRRILLPPLPPLPKLQIR